ncbi:phosphatidylinositol-specific phospholipase C/glycerophosphodiester phosphodiesterase family protein [Dyadobacter arcticus]|uniref:Altered inheritance of mitochondria protein 6 n=1 Tax=Dyadobacter arcticus TaxID=1078754 RepID=A0ABX0UFN2_9BACT|nr:phosphatidylinositol-specific phospholipase C/glycerophosphodiester phosphodiesterase family protein [Dyadobacter arcticus]NIJ51791.1 alkaline phosphatase [Dyadobacter arcticus]
MKYRFTILITLFFGGYATAQNIKAYTTAQAHSHNDYVRPRAFFDAYDQQFGSIEADLYLVRDTLFVAHDLKDITPAKTFSALYLKPILQQVEKNSGNIYPQKDVPLQLLIDLKTSGEETLAALMKELEPYQEVLAPKGQVTIVISGNVPDPTLFEKYPPYISFDGRPENTYTADQLAHIGLISQAFQRYSRWNGEGPLPEKDKKNILKMIEETHKQGKKVRIWATPDNINSWKTMMALGVDYLNTDKVKEMGDYLRTAPR